MSYMYHDAKRFNQPLNHWNVSNVQYMSYMFANASKFNQSLHDWNTTNAFNMEGTFVGINQKIAWYCNYYIYQVVIIN